MKLSKEHIDNLYLFTKKHFVEWYDLQTELVDHLANDIENIWKEKPHLTFKQAKYKASVKFGIYGFTKVISNREKALRKKYNLLSWQFFKDYFKLPKIILTLFYITLTFSFFNFIEDKSLLLKIISTSLVVISILFFSYNLYKRKKREKKSGKKWMFEQRIYDTSFFPLTIFSFFVQSNIILKEGLITNWSTLNQLVISIALVLFALIFYIMAKIVPSKLEENASKQYSEYRLYKKT